MIKPSLAAAIALCLAVIGASAAGLWPLSVLLGVGAGAAGMWWFCAHVLDPLDDEPPSERPGKDDE